MKKLFLEFRKFIAKGNVIDMAVGVIIGGAFSKIVTSLVNDIIMPLVSMAMGGNSMSSLVLVLNGEPLYLDGGAINPAALVWHYGSFIQSIINFLIIALCVFFIMKLVVSLQRGASAAKGALEKGVKTLANREGGETAAENTATDADAKNADAKTPVAENTAMASAEVPVAEEKTAESNNAIALTENVAAVTAVAESGALGNDEIVALLKEIRDSLKK